MDKWVTVKSASQSWSGRVVYQELERINVAIRTNELQQNSSILAAIAYAKDKNKTLHLAGLVSDGAFIRISIT
jgi:bisphosphoglycerate-independent phosphoglycerate mutase (AlkP superfamily)